MNYIYLAIGIILGIIYLGRAKNARKQKFVSYEAKMKLKNKKHMYEYDKWCKNESKGCYLVGGGFMLFGIASTFMDSNLLICNILSIISLIIFIIGFVTRILNNKKRLGHYFSKQ